MMPIIREKTDLPAVLTLRMLAAYLGVSMPWIRSQLLSKPDFPYLKLPGRQTLRFPRDEVFDWLARYSERAKTMEDDEDV